MFKIILLSLILFASSWGQFQNFTYPQLDRTMRLVNTSTDYLVLKDTATGDTIGILDSVTFAVIDSSVIVGDSFTAQQHMDALRSILYPWRSTTYLPIDSVYTTPSITADTPTKVLIPTVAKEINGFGFNDVGGGEIALQFEAPMGIQDSIGFSVTMTTSMRSSANNTIVKLSMYKNGLQEQGVIIARKITTGTDTGALAIHGHFHLVTGDYVEIYVETSITSSISFENTSIDIYEKY